MQIDKTRIAVVSGTTPSRL